MKKKRRENRFTRYSKKGLIFIAIIFFLGFVSLNSYEATLIIKYERLEKEVGGLESDIDGLDMKVLELTNFSRLETIAEKKGYLYKQNIATAALIGIPRD